MFVSDHFADSFGILDSALCLLREIWRVLLQTMPLSCGWRRDRKLHKIASSAVLLGSPPTPQMAWQDAGGNSVRVHMEGGMLFPEMWVFFLSYCKFAKASQLPVVASSSHVEVVEVSTQWNLIKLGIFRVETASEPPSMLIQGFHDHCAAFKTPVFPWSASRSLLPCCPRSSSFTGSQSAVKASKPDLQKLMQCYCQAT